VLASLNDMGNTNAGIISGTTMTKGDTITLGSTLGVSDYTLTVAQVPALSFGGTTGNDSPDHAHAVPPVMQSSGVTAPARGGPAFLGGNTSGLSTGGASTRYQHSFSGSTSGGGGTHQIMQPTMLITTYLKL
jgi:hypothetical protein